MGSQKKTPGGGVGVKLFSTNIGSVNAVREYRAKQLIDYVELLALPGTCDGKMRHWQGLDAPFIIHVPHASYGFNLSDPKMRRHNAKLFEESRRFADRLNAEFMIVHPGLIGAAEETIRQINKLNESRIIIENKPFIALNQKKCVGWSPEEIKLIMRETGVGFCLDIVHAVKAAYASGLDHIETLKRFMALRPRIVHLCDCKINGCFDEHLNLGKGELDLRRIIDLALAASARAKFTLEVPERSYEKLTSFKHDRLLLADCLEGRR